MTTKPTFYALEKSGDNETTVTLYDEIGAFGAGSKQFLGEITKLSGQHIHLRINSPWVPWLKAPRFTTLSAGTKEG